MNFNWIQPISKEIFNKKYNLYNETEEEVFRNISKEIASVEEDKKLWEDVFFETISSTKFIPAGRILANARPFSKLKNYNNCFTIKLDDDMNDIYDALRQDALISKMGGGVGFNVSGLRPEGDELSRGGVASGPLSFLKVFNESAKIIMVGGARRCLPKKYYFIQMADKQWKKIFDINVGDEINFQDKPYKIKNIFDNGKQKLLKINTPLGHHICSENHKWLVYNNSKQLIEWITAKEIKKNPTNFNFLKEK